MTKPQLRKFRLVAAFLDGFGIDFTQYEPLTVEANLDARGSNYVWIHKTSGKRFVCTCVYMRNGQVAQAGRYYGELQF